MFIPDFTKVEYLLNQETGRYEKQPDRVPFEKLPFELKVETTQDPRIKANGATEIITGRIKNGKRLFFTGLIQTKESNWFFGNDYQFKNGEKKNSLIVFYFHDNNRRLYVYYFNNYYKDNRAERVQFVLNFIVSLK